MGLASMVLALRTKARYDNLSDAGLKIMFNLLCLNESRVGYKAFVFTNQDMMECCNIGSCHTLKDARSELVEKGYLEVVDKCSRHPKVYRIAPLDELNWKVVSYKEYNYFEDHGVCYDRVPRRRLMRIQDYMCAPEDDIQEEPENTAEARDEYTDETMSEGMYENTMCAETMDDTPVQVLTIQKPVIQYHEDVNCGSQAMDVVSDTEAATAVQADAVEVCHEKKCAIENKNDDHKENNLREYKRNEELEPIAGIVTEVLGKKQADNQVAEEMEMLLAEFEYNFHRKPQEAEMPELIRQRKKYGTVWVAHAIVKAKENKVCELSYMNGILKRWGVSGYDDPWEHNCFPDNHGRRYNGYQPRKYEKPKTLRDITDYTKEPKTWAEAEAMLRQRRALA